MAKASTPIPEPKKTWLQWQLPNWPLWLVTPFGIILLIYIVTHWHDEAADTTNVVIGWILLALSIAIISAAGIYGIIYRYWKYTRDGQTY